MRATRAWFNRGNPPCYDGRVTDVSDLLRDLFSELGEEDELPAGAWLWREGHVGDDVVMLREGTLEVVHEGPEGEIVILRELEPGAVLGEIACDNPRGEAWTSLEPCGSASYSPALAPFGGLSTATNYAPTYYVVTAFPYRACEETSQWSPRTCGRIANTTWLALASAGFLTLMLLLGGSLVSSLIISVGVSIVPAVLLQGITVNPDAL